MVTLTDIQTHDAVRQARIDLAAAHRLAVRDDLHEGTWNHLSLSVPRAPERMLVSPSFTHWSQVTASSLVDVGPGGVADEMDEAAWIAYRIHYPLHVARPDAACIMHTHAPYVTALAMIDEELNTAEQNALTFYGRIAYTSEFDPLGREGTEQGEFLAAALGDDAIALIMKNHGAVVVGPTVGHAYSLLYVLERACRAQILAMSTGRSLASLPPAQLAILPRFEFQELGERDYLRLHFEGMKRVLDASEPDYAT